MAEVELDGPRGTFAVGDARLADETFHAVFPADAFDVNIEVQLAHAGDDRLVGFRVAGDLEGGVFPAEAFEGFAEFVGPVPLQGFDGQTDDRLRHEDAFEGVFHAIATAK